ncbi:hypothetical protein Ssi03_28300 [Sphaerisporangium siamense]|nr:hypothetical protein Ssi03_28300 [Sphaerisporangium siamense]
MGLHPGGRGPAWLGACALLAVQITVTGLASARPASASAPRRPAAAHEAGDAARHRPDATSPAARHTARVRTLNNALPATRYATNAPRLSRAAAAAQARTGVLGAALWRQHRLYHALRLGHAQAARRLRHAGLRWRSSGHCASRHRRSCTSLDTVRLGTLWGVVDLKRRSGCPIVVTGGTEIGHAHGPRSHGQGYKLDIEHNKCVDRYIRTKQRGEVRGDGAGTYSERRPQGRTMYANEPSHWDITFL